jgi:hypothetical protein
MTPLERTCVCGATLRIETDDLKYADKKARAWEKMHSRCQVKPKDSILGHPSTKKRHYRKTK